MTSLFSEESAIKVPLDTSATQKSVSCSSNPNELIFRNMYCPEKLIDSLAPKLRTYDELLNYAVSKYDSRPCLSYRPFDYEKKTSNENFISLTYNEMNELRLRIGSGILAALARIDPKLVDDHYSNYESYDETNMSPIISIFSANRYEWTVTDCACHAYSLTNTALYDNLGDGVSAHVLRQTRSPVVFCSGDKLSKIRKLHREQKLSVKVVVSFDPISEIERAKLEDSGFIVYTFSELAVLGEMAGYERCPPCPKTLFTISFTSGTTGANPKGVLLNHVTAVSGITFLLSVTRQISNGRCFIFLPLTHIYERQTSSFALMAGYNLGYPKLTLFEQKQDQFKNLVEDLRLFKPHYFSIVPRILIKFESLIKNHIAQDPDASSINQIIEKRAKEQALVDNCDGQEANFEPYQRLRSLVGFDNLVWTQTASAPVNAKTLMYIKASLGIGVSQLYGLTETFGAMTTSLIHEAKPGSCGSISPTVEVKLLEHREMNYLTSDGKGEILIRGPQVCQGYFSNPDENKKAFDSDGWFYTGDVGQIVDGKLYIIDRVKNFFKLAQGEYISPEKIENIYLTNNQILSQLFVHGHPTQHFVVAIVGITLDTGLQLLGKSSLTAEEMLQEINKKENKITILKNLNSRISDQLNGIEKIGNLHFEIEPLTVERRVVTPTMKIMRPMAAKFFSPKLAAMYDEGMLLTKSRL